MPCTQAKFSAMGRVLLAWMRPMKCQVISRPASAAIFGTELSGRVSAGAIAGFAAMLAFMTFLFGGLVALCVWAYDAAGGSACVFGHSSGAVLALEAATRLPAKVRKQVLFEPPFVVDDSRPRVPADFVAYVTELVAAGQRGDAVAYFMTDAVGVPREFVDGMKKSPMWAEMERSAHTLVYDGTLMGDTQAGKPLPAARWATAKAPALVLSGGASDAWLHAAAEALAALLPDAEHRVLEGLDHSAAIMAPQKLAPVLTEFLAD